MFPVVREGARTVGKPPTRAGEDATVKPIGSPECGIDTGGTLAYIDTLVDNVDDPKLQDALRGEIRRLRGNREFGLIFERHLPEFVRLLSHPVKRGVKVQERATQRTPTWTVVRVADGVAHLVDVDGVAFTRPVDNLVVVREFGEPVFPGLRRVGRVDRGGDKPFHAVVNAENYHALEMLTYLYEGQVDCIYIDPPYNTGARDWKYNNDYVDSADSYRHSKWLSFMERRLRQAKRLLNPGCSVLVITIDEHEVHHLGVLLEDLFPDAIRQLTTIVVNPLGQARRRSSDASRNTHSSSSWVLLSLSPSTTTC